MSIADSPPLERPTEKLLNGGPAVLSDAELLAVLLQTGIKGKNALDLARDLLTSFGGAARHSGRRSTGAVRPPWRRQGQGCPF